MALADKSIPEIKPIASIGFKRRFLRDSTLPNIDEEQNPIKILNSIIRAQYKEEVLLSKSRNITSKSNLIETKASKSLQGIIPVIPTAAVPISPLLLKSSPPSPPPLVASIQIITRLDKISQPPQLDYTYLNSGYDGNDKLKLDRAKLHSTNSIQSDSYPGIQMFKCGQCIGIFHSQKSLTIHMIQRHNFRNGCMTEGRSRIRNGNGGRIRVGKPLNIPTEEFDGINPKDILTCTYCPRQFPNPSTLRVHMNSHTRERPYACTYCNKRFFQSSHLTVHIRTHTGEKPYQCTFCKNTFNSPSNCRVHERTHMKGNEVYHCQECNIGFLHKSRLERHLRSRKHVHPNGIIPQD